MRVQCRALFSRMVVGYFFLVLQHLAVELIHHQINRGIHVRIAGFDVDIFALQVNADFGFATAISKIVMNGGAGEAVSMARSNLRNIPRG